METNKKLLKSRVKERFLERLAALGFNLYDKRILELGIPRHKIQSMLRNTTGDVPGIILERVCTKYPELDVAYICCGTSNQVAGQNDAPWRKICQDLVSNYKQRDALLDKMTSMAQIHG